MTGTIFETYGNRLAWQVVQALPAESWQGHSDKLHPEKITDNRFLAACEFVARNASSTRNIPAEELIALIEAWETVERGVVAAIAIYRTVRPADKFVVESLAERHYPEYGAVMRNYRQQQASEYAHLKSPLDRGY